MIYPGYLCFFQMEIPAPNAFNNELAQWIANKCTKSIVFVELVPKNAPKLKELWDEVVPLPVHEKAEDNKAAHDERLANCYHHQCSTGSVVKDDEGDLWLLTCAHVLGPVFNNQHPITATAVNRLFNPRIICDHNEQRYKRGLAHNPDLNRTYMRARVVEIDGPRDLMLLFVPQHEVSAVVRILTQHSEWPACFPRGQTGWRCCLGRLRRTGQLS